MRARQWILAALAIVALPSAWLAAQVVQLDHRSPPAISTSVASATVPLRPDAAIAVSLQGYGAELRDVRLYRTDIQADGTRGREQPVAIGLQAAEAGTWHVVGGAGATALRPDGEYRLGVAALIQRPALPLPQVDVVAREYRFRTVAGPRPMVSAEPARPRWAEPARPRWAEPVAVSWTIPVAAVAADVQPRAPLRVWVDPQDARRTWVQIGGDGGADVQAGQVYDVLFTRARSVDGLEMQRPVPLKVAVPERPRIVGAPGGTVTLQVGQTLELVASTPLADARLEASGEIPTALRVDGRRLVVSFPTHVQGADVALRLASATSTEGAPLVEPVTVRVKTPPPLQAPTFEPEDGATGVRVGTHPVVVFPEPVANRAAAERALSLEPAVDGRWEWRGPDRAEFVPQGYLPHATRITLTVAGGPAGPRSRAGGYRDQDASIAFETDYFKRLDVNLSRQTMNLIEDGKVVRTIAIASGVAGAETPTGDFAVQYKMPQARFRGVNPSGLRYDIPDVNWVMAFHGDYTIHGAYWRGRFGTPGSAGCVSMMDADAKVVYDWAEVGTPISIHY